VHEPRPIPGAKRPLFDRLQDEGTLVRQPVSASRSITIEALRESVRRDLSALLNTRCNLPARIRELSEGTVVAYGIPNLSPISPANDSAHGELAQILQDVIARYEPRLKNVKVYIQPDKKDPLALLGQVQAQLVFGSVMEQVYFPLSLSGAGDRVDVAGA
jgi:type VI secretion system protein ImpF